MRWIVAIALFAFTPVVLACSFTQPVPVDLDESLALPNDVPPSAPAITVESVTRGDPDHPFYSCADTGVVVLSVPAKNEARELAYSFELISGIADDMIFEPGPSTGFYDEERGKILFVFPWIDGATLKQEPLDLAVRVTSMRLSGLAGEPSMVRVVDPGR